MKKFIRRVCLLALPLLLTACASTVVSTNPNTRKGSIDTLQLTRVDFEYAAKKSLDDFMMSPWLDAQKGKRWLVQINNVRNETTLELDTKRLTQRMMSHMIRSGKFAFLSLGGSLADSAAKDYQQLDKSELYAPADEPTALADRPDLSMIGEIQQTTVVSVDRSKQQLEYEFRLRVTDLKSRTIIFDALVPIDKLGSNKNFSW